MTKLLYQTDSYQKNCEAQIIEIVTNGIVLDQTVFYPQGGGQPFDLGTIEQKDNKWIVTGVKKQDGKIVHFIEDTSTLASGQKIKAAINWERRHKLMRTHTAMHILAAVIWRDYEAKVTGGNMEPEKGRMDFELEGMQRSLVDEIEKKINDEVQQDRKVKVQILPREEAFQIPDLIRTKTNLVPEHITEIRIVEIEGLDLQADGGTHVASTKEVGPIRISDYKSKGRKNKRLMISLTEE